MRTTILLYVIAVLGLVMICTGVWTLFNLFGERDRGSPVPQRDYAMAITMICIGFAMGGIVQSLRLLLFLLSSFPVQIAH
jgi:succinate dehydrogenase/fumarate reductase cytochrome b subunit